MIIVDGPDGSGKTTLCENLVKDGVVLSKLESPGRTKGQLSLRDQTLRYLNAYINRNLAVDRYLFSEMVYGPILRKYCAFSTTDFFSILSKLIHAQNPIIFCLPENPESLKLTMEQMPGVRENITEIFLSYLNYYEFTSRIYTRVFRYDLNNQYSYHRLKDFLRERDRFQIRAPRG